MQLRNFVYGLLKIVLYIFIFEFGYAQDYIDTLNIEGRIKAKIINQQNGNLLVATTKATYGIDSKSRKLVWKIKDLDKVFFSSYQEFEDSPFVLLQRKTLLNSKFIAETFNTRGSSFVILNTNDGSIYFDSQNYGYKATINVEFLREKNEVLFSGLKDTKIFLCHVDLTDKSKFWEIELVGNEIFKASKRQFLGFQKNFRNKNNSIFWLLDTKLQKIKPEDGSILYTENQVNNIDYLPEKDIIFSYRKKINTGKANQENLIMAYDSENMKPIWKDSLRVYGKIKKTQIYNNELIIITDTGFEAIKINKGKKRWNDKLNISLIENVIPSKDYYLVIQDQFLDKIDTLNNRKWKKPVKIFKTDDSGMFYIKQDKDQILSITPSYIYKIDAKTGENLWQKPTTLNKSTYVERSVSLSQNRYRVWYDKKQNDFLVFSNADLYQVKNTDTLKPKHLHTFKYTDIPKLEIRDHGYFFHQKNNFVFFNQDHTKVYDTVLANISNQSFIKATKSLSKKAYNIYKTSLGVIPKQIDNTFKTLLITNNVSGLSQTGSFLYGNYHNYVSLYDELTTFPDIDVGSYLEYEFKNKKTDRKAYDNFLVAVPGNNEFQFKSLEKETGKIINLKSVKLKSKDIMIDQLEKLIYVFSKKNIWIIPLDDF